MGRVVAVESVGYGAWKYTLGDTAPFDVWYRGKRIYTQTSLTEITIDEIAFLDAHGEAVDYEEPPMIEVLDASDTGLALSEQYPRYLVIQWRGRTTNSHYVVRQYNGATWDDRGVLPEDGRGYYVFATDQLDDGENHQWRVVAVDSQGNESDPINATVEMVCHPAPPRISVGYSNPNFVISARA